MSLNGWFQIALFCAVVVALARPLGGYMSRVFTGERTLLSPVLSPVERGLYRVAGIDAEQEQHWLAYASAMLAFHVLGFLTLYALLRVQALLPFNPDGQAGVAPDLAFNTATSFVTNTNWQSYGGETTLSYLTQMLGLTHQNFLSAATGIALAVALVRGFSRASAKTVGSFWVDVTRTTLYVLLPLCMVLTLFYVWQGIPPDAFRRRRGDHSGGREADPRGRPRGEPGRHQDAGHQWRRRSSTPTPRIRSRTPPRSRTSFR